MTTTTEREPEAAVYLATFERKEPAMSKIKTPVYVNVRGPESHLDDLKIMVCEPDGHVVAFATTKDQADQIAATLNAANKERGPHVVCLCGSTRFYEAFQRWNYLLTMQGKIVLSVGFYRRDLTGLEPGPKHEYHGENIGCTPEQKIALDELHKRKIDLADSVMVLNVGGYIGNSTRGEIEYAAAHGKPVAYLEPIQLDPGGETIRGTR